MFQLRGTEQRLDHGEVVPDIESASEELWNYRRDSRDNQRDPRPRDLQRRVHGLK